MLSLQLPDREVLSCLDSWADRYREATADSEPVVRLDLYAERTIRLADTMNSEFRIHKRSTNTCFHSDFDIQVLGFDAGRVTMLNDINYTLLMTYCI